jgi:class 3 adenylate cyclase/tetratricopeptide (TPR) repeat protein
MIVCPACSRENPDDARFCSGCATPLDAEPAPAREERKVVTVLFCDLVGFTARSEAMDPEDVRALLSGYHERVRRELERHGGTVEKFVGDAVMALFGAPVAHEDDPERAVRAALAIRDRIELVLRIGITTGEALVTGGAELRVAGDVVNTASRLQSACPENGILVDETTYGASRRQIDYHDAGSIEAKGKAAPVRAWEAIEPRARFGMDVAEVPSTPLVGRDSELQLLRTALRRAREERTPQLVSLVGAPGIGKSRLVRELFRAVEQDPDLIYWRQGRSLPYGEGVAFWAVGEMVKAEAGILETDDENTAESKLERAVANLIEDDAAAWVVRHLRPLVGAGGEAGGTEDRRDEAFTAWRRFFEALAEQNSLVLVFEDLQWADDGLLDFVDHLVDWAAGVPILVVCGARPELLSKRPTWGGGKANASTVSLGPLSAEDTTRLVSNVLHQAVLPVELQAALVAKAGGNPLFAEEYIRMLQDRGYLTREGSTWTVVRSDELPLPGSVQATIAARLDALTTADKALLQDAAVVGKIFWLGAVVALDGRGRADAEEALRALARRQLVQAARRPSLAGEPEYAFSHALVRDVAYGQIPRLRRAEKHRLAAEWIESLGRPEDHADLVAHHYLSALEYARASGQPVDDLVQPTRHALIEAADRAAALNANAAATRLYDEAIRLTDDEDPARPFLRFRWATVRFPSQGVTVEELEEVRAELIRAGEPEPAAEIDVLIEFTLHDRGETDLAAEHLQRAVELVAGLPPSRAKVSVLGALSRQRGLAGDAEEAIRIGREAVAMAETLELDDLRAHHLNTIGYVRVTAGDPDGIADLDESVAIARRINAPELIRDYGNLSSVLLDLGQIARSSELIERAIVEAERFGAASLLVWLQGERVVRHYFAGLWDEVLREFESFLEASAPAGGHFVEAPCLAVRAKLEMARGDEVAALLDADRLLGLTRKGKDPQLLHPGLATAALVRCLSGDNAAAGALVDELFADWKTHEVLASAFWLVDLAYALRELGRADEMDRVLSRVRLPTRWVDAARAVAADDLAAAAEAFAEMGSVPDAAYARLRSGRPEHVGSALEFFRSVGAARYVREGEALLARTA